MTDETLFTDALALPDAAARAAFLGRACPDPVQRQRVAELLAAHFADGPFLTRPAGADLAVTADRPRPEPTVAFEGGAAREVAQADAGTAGAGAVVGGRYTLVEVIGEGGMGSVWRARQTEPVKRFVAVKLIKAGMDSRQVLARFEAERQALALMDHPNIAKVLDGGLHEGRPYFVMELVKGTPITEFCDARKLTPQQRLELFIPVCQAIQHAHQKGVIHRDIKPSNVLVALYDDRPVVKVIDFGVAKATRGALTDLSIDTGFGGIVGTPQYMSPEQATINNLDIDTRTDVYALGVLLYELLAGSPPFSAAELKQRGLLEMLRVVREEEPPKPSTKLSTAAAKPSISANRGTEPKKLTGLLRNELDWIVMKALEKDRSRRYETANGFAADVMRYLCGEAVLAHPPSRAYRIKKFVRRNQVQVIAAGLVLLTLVAGVIGTSLGLLEARRQASLARDEAIAKEAALVEEAVQTRKAQTKEAEANATVRFFEDRVFARARPKGQAGGLGSPVTLRDAVVASLPSLGQEFAEQPLVEARLRMSVGTSLLYLGEHELAREQFARARDLHAAHLGPDHPFTIMSMTNLAASYAELGRHAEALTLREEALAASQRALPPDHPDTLRAMHNLANSYTLLARHADALKLYQEALAASRRALPPDHPDILANLNNQAINYDALGRRADALRTREELLATRRRVLPADHPDTLKSMTNVALSYAMLGRHADAARLGEEAVSGQKRALPPDHPDTLKGMNNLSLYYGSLNRHAESLRLREETLAAQKRVLPTNHPDVLRSMHNLAMCYEALNRHADATKLYEETLALRKRVLPENHPDTLRSMHNLANCYESLSRHADGLKLHEETLAIRKRVLPADHPDTLLSMYGVAKSLLRLGRGAEALLLIDECLAKTRGKDVDSRLVPGLATLRLRHFRAAANPAECRATAEMWHALGRTDADSLYTEASFRAVTATVQAKATEADAATRARGDADRAMELLQKAVDAGYQDHSRMKEDTDLDPLRDRDDFKKLLADLEKRFPAQKEVLPMPREMQ